MKTTATWIQEADTALKRAAKRAREIAMRTDTAMHVVRDGKIVKLMPAQDAWVLREEPPAYGTKSK